MSATKNILAMREQFINKLKHANIFDNFFMHIVLEKKEVCQYVLCKLLKKPDLIVLKCKTEVQISKLFGKDSRLDVLATDKTGKIFNIEIQKEKEEFHELRVRYYHSAIDSEIIRKGNQYSELPPVYVIYISKNDIWHKGATIYRVEKILTYHNESDTYNDKQYTLYFNAEVKDTTEQEISDLMDYFKTCNPTDSSQGVLSEYVHYLKTDEKGNNTMYEELYEEFKKELGDEIRKELGDEIRKELGDEIRKELGNEIRKELGNEIRKELGDEIRNKIEDDIRKRTKAESIVQIMINLKVSFEKALKTLNIPKEEQEEYSELIHCFYPNMMQFK